MESLGGIALRGPAGEQTGNDRRQLSKNESSARDRRRDEPSRVHENRERERVGVTDAEIAKCRHPEPLIRPDEAGRRRNGDYEVEHSCYEQDFERSERYPQRGRHEPCAERPGGPRERATYRDLQHEPAPKDTSDSVRDVREPG